MTVYYRTIIMGQTVVDENRNKGPKKPLEILYEGFYYDITDFARKHPGGNVIMFYTEPGEEATQAMQQFHNRFINKIHLMLKSFKSRPATKEDLAVRESATRTRHQGLTDDFAKLFVDIKKEGLFEPSYWRIVARMGEIIGMVLLSVFLVYQPSVLLQILGALIFGIAGGRAGWLMHEGGHHSLTGRPKVDKYIQSVFIGVFVGLSGGWWNRGHNKHHAMPQRIAHDVDLNTMPFMAYNAKLIKNAEQGRSFFIQNQTWLFLSLNCFAGYLVWRLYICPRNALKKGDYLDLLMMSIHMYLSLTYVPQLWIALLAYWIGANYMFGNFALSHTHLPVTETATHWVEYGLTHTANVKSTPFVDWWMGYLNFQIEHHLFPTLPQYKSHLIRDRVRALARKYDLPYHELTLKDAWVATLKNFEDVAKQFRV